jgi:hypothetical protein
MLHLQINDREIERVLTGQQPSARSDLAEVARFLAHLRATTAAAPVPPMQPSLVAQLDAADREHRVVRFSRRRALEVERERTRREVAKAHLRWRIVGAAAIVVMLGGVVVAGLQTAPEPSPTETDGNLTPSNQVVDPPQTQATTPPASKPPPETEPPAPAPEPTPQAEVPQAPLDSDRSGDPSVSVGSVDWPWAWPDACTEGDFACWWEEFQNGNGNGNGPPPGRGGH